MNMTTNLEAGPWTPAQKEFVRVKALERFQEGHPITNLSTVIAQDVNEKNIRPGSTIPSVYMTLYRLGKKGLLPKEWFKKRLLRPVSKGKDKVAKGKNSKHWTEEEKRYLLEEVKRGPNAPESFATGVLVLVEAQAIAQRISLSIRPRTTAPAVKKMFQRLFMTRPSFWNLYAAPLLPKRIPTKLLQPPLLPKPSNSPWPPYARGDVRPAVTPVLPNSMKEIKIETQYAGRVTKLTMPPTMDIVNEVLDRVGLTKETK
jgi:hypothetical protein